MVVACFLLLTIILFLATASSTTTSSSVVINASQTSHGGCIPAERAALLSFKAGLTGDPDNRLVSWQQGAHTDNCCRWTGITCSRRTGHVIKLDLHYDDPMVYYLSDDEPESHSLRGQLSPSLLALRRLKYLDLSQNYLLGDAKDMPGFLGSLQSLIYLNLSKMGFQGRVPPQLGNLSNLVQIDIQRNIMGAGYQYSHDISWLARLRSLEHLNMGWIDLSGVVDWVHTAGALPNLAVLILFQCGLTNSNVPSSFVHHNLTVLEEVDLTGNQFSSPDTPNWLWNVTSLRSLRLENCGLSGTFSNKLGNLTLLETFAFGLNNVDGMIPGTLKKMCNLRSLDLTGNDISMDIKEYIGFSDNNLEVIIDSHWVPPFNLESAWLSSCRLGPKFPKWLRWQKGIRELDISNTGLVDRLPDWFWATFSEVTWLDISWNQLSGDLPANLEFMSVITLLMQSNLLTGLIPKLPSTIKVLDISRNFLNGFVPNLGAPNLQVAVMFSNAISGLFRLQFVDCGNCGS
ncbi:hypothetical protein CFC21_014231 [Triticum aestivum]|uniref:Leucine-rich repeat-containing N-terminal plant-type domain-containing protein n=2 Tax=Triticum aestivum TaxID=4565 RepID=A0A9R1IZ91_WHEAT|nr:hypothetical protein CFC21_014231 [Triticum aestivum]